MLLFLLVTHILCDSSLVDQWFAMQSEQWARVRAHCRHLAVFFTDSTWLPLTLKAIDELLAPPERAACVALWLWMSANDSLPLVCARAPCFVDQRASASAAWGSRAYFN